MTSQFPVIVNGKDLIAVLAVEAQWNAVDRHEFLLDAVTFGDETVYYVLCQYPAGMSLSTHTMGA